MSIHSRWFLLNEKEISTCFVNAKGSSSCEAFNHLKWDHFCATNSCLISALHPALASPSFAFHFIYLWYPFPLTWSCHSDPTLLPLVGLRTGTRGSSGGMCWSWWVAGWVDGWGGCPGRRHRTSPSAVGGAVRMKVPGVLDQLPCLPHVLDLLFGELGRPCPGCLQRRVVSW